MIATRGFHHAAVQVRDVAKVGSFYETVLGLPVVKRHLHPDGTLRSVWFAVAEGNSAFLAIEHREGTEPLGMGWSMVALSIDATKRSEVRAHLEGQGVAIERETAFTLYVKDPEGNLVGLSHYPETA